MIEEFIQLRNSLLEGLPNNIAVNKLATILCQFKIAKPNTFHKHHTLVTGVSGVGKSYSLRILLEKIDLPFISVDCTALTESGYDGQSVTDMVDDIILRIKENGVDKGIIFLDEFDKISFKKASKKKDISCGAVQYSLLKLLDGHDYKTSDKNISSRVRLNEDNYFNSQDLLIIAAGNFGLFDEVKKLKHSELVKIGFYPELIARFSNIVNFPRLNNQYIEKIFNDLPSIKYYINFFKVYNINFEVSISAKKELIISSDINQFGFRAIDIIIDELLLNYILNIQSNKIKTIRLDFNKQFIFLNDLDAK